MRDIDVLTNTFSAYLMIKLRKKLIPYYLVRKANKLTKEIELFRHNYRIKPRFIRLPHYRVIDSEKLNYLIDADYQYIQGRRYFNITYSDSFYDEANELHLRYLDISNQIERFMYIFYRTSLTEILQNRAKNLLTDINNNQDYQKIIDEINGLELLER